MATSLLHHGPENRIQNTSRNMADIKGPRLYHLSCTLQGLRTDQLTTSRAVCFLWFVCCLFLCALFCFVFAVCFLFLHGHSTMGYVSIQSVLFCRREEIKCRNSRTAMGVKSLRPAWFEDETVAKTVMYFYIVLVYCHQIQKKDPQTGNKNTTEETGGRDKPFSA